MLDLIVRNNKLLLGTVNGTKPNNIIICYVHIYDVNYFIRNAVY